MADAMTGQEAVNIAQGFDEALDLTGIILTKMDGDARGGAALSIHGVTGKPIKFVGTGEGVDALDSADPQRLAGRILQMGDVVGLVERAQAAMDQEEQARLEEKVLGKGRFTLEDFLTTLRQVQRMGPLEQLVKLIPGMGSKLPLGNVDPQADEARGGDHPLHDPSEERRSPRSSTARGGPASPGAAGGRWRR